MENLQTVKVALLGLGTVGQGVYKLVQSQKEEMPFKIGSELAIQKILVRDLAKKREGIPA